MTDEGTSQTTQNLTDDEILKRAEMISEARKLENEERQRQVDAENARRLAEAERIKKEQEAEAERIKKEEDEKKAAELRRAHELVDAENAAKPKKKHTAGKIVLAIILLLIIVGGVAVLSFDVTSTSTYTTALPYTSHYTLWFNQGTTSVAGLDIMLTGDATQMMVTMPGKPTDTLSQGQTVSLGPYKATVSLFWGAWNVYDIVYQVKATYMGVSNENLATFDTYISTNKQLPESLFNLYLTFCGVKHAKA